jgi:hypothetical protein
VEGGNFCEKERDWFFGHAGAKQPRVIIASIMKYVDDYICFPKFFCAKSFSRQEQRERNLCPRAIFFFVNQLASSAQISPFSSIHTILQNKSKFIKS